ncbi:MAG: hypothetical protein ACRD2F_04725, partial [Terriglobales bacterium]
VWDLALAAAVETWGAPPQPTLNQHKANAAPPAARENQRERCKWRPSEKRETTFFGSYWRQSWMRFGGLRGNGLDLHSPAGVEIPQRRWLVRLIPDGNPPVGRRRLGGRLVRAAARMARARQFPLRTLILQRVPLR